MSARPRLTGHEEAALVEALCAGDGRAAVQLVEAYLRLVLEVARRYQNHGVALTVLLQEGSLALLQAVRGYGRDRGYSLGAHVSWCIRGAISATIARHGHLVPLPPGTLAAINRLAQASTRLAAELGREATDVELARAAGTTIGRLAKLRKLAVVHSGGDDVRSSEESMLDGLRLDVHSILCVLTARERRVLQLRYGLTEGKPRSPGEVGRRLGLAGANVCLMEQAALAKLRRARSLGR